MLIDYRFHAASIAHSATTSFVGFFWFWIDHLGKHSNNLVSEAVLGTPTSSSIRIRFLYYRTLGLCLGHGTSHGSNGKQQHCLRVMPTHLQYELWARAGIDSSQVILHLVTLIQILVHR